MIGMLKLVLRIYLEFIKLLILYFCLGMLALFAYSTAALVPVFLMFVFTEWSAVKMAIALFPVYILYYIVFKLHAERTYLKIRDYLKVQINKRKPNPETHCPNCGYDLRGLKIIRCPECGKFNPKFNPRKYLKQHQQRK
jgi:hypothetical protein